ncbi:MULTISPECIES: ABC transporter permease [unclassified Beijerinckia]|uniref:ABC transporter permease n=1 Tax=unclassified Beijerinckia TaxID=2638183 RepID=UPI000A8627FB|nr:MULTISPECIES: ABC transporter permease [unclassified Beijerinckia]
MIEAPAGPAFFPARKVTFERLRRFKWPAVRLLSVLLVLGLWEVFAQSGQVSRFLLPTFSSVLERLADNAMSGILFENTAFTIYRALAGFAIAAVLGVAIGLGMHASRIVHWFLDPIISVIFPMPKIAFLPIFVLWLGVFDASKIFMVVVDAILPVIAATLVGIRGVDRQLIWSARNMGASERRILWDVILPAAFPAIMTGLQVALPIAIVVEIATEMLTGGRGLGGAMLESSRNADSPETFAGIVAVAVVGFVLVKGAAMLRRRLLRWHAEGQA